LIAGLGNPGPVYERTRHNIGFMVVDELSRRLGVAFDRGPGEYLLASRARGNVTIHLMKPSTYMNNSGTAVVEAADLHALIPTVLLVVIDDFQLPLGVLRLRARGSDGGHKGLASVISHFGTEDIPRLRCGIGKEVMPPPEKRRDFVLAPFDQGELAVAREMVARAADAASLFATSGIHYAMNMYNAH